MKVTTPFVDDPRCPICNAYMLRVDGKRVCGALYRLSLPVRVS